MNIYIYISCIYISHGEVGGWSVLHMYICESHMYIHIARKGGGLGSRPKKMYGERLGDGVEYHLMSTTPRRQVPFTTGRRAH